MYNKVDAVPETVSGVVPLLALYQPMDIAVYMYVFIVETFLFSLSPIGHAHVKSIVLCAFWLLERGFPETWPYSLSFKLIFNDYFKISCHLRFLTSLQAVSHL